MKKSLFVISLLVIVLFITLWFWVSSQDGDNNFSTITVDRYSTLEDIEYDEDKINIYFFWGNGCSHCEELFTFFESIDEKYRDMYNLYVFEVWYDEDNGIIMDYFLEYFDLTTGERSVPTFIIGEEIFQGYNSSMDNEIIDTITDQYKNRDSINKFDELVTTIEMLYNEN